MAHRPLTDDEVTRLARLLRTEYQRLVDLRTSEPLARHIQFPKVPSLLTESLVLHALERGLIIPEVATGNPRRGGRVADILAGPPEDPVRIEVKASGASDFVRFKPKDLVAEYLVWADFSHYLRDGRLSEINAYVARQPGKFAYGNPDCVTLATFIKNAAPNLTRARLPLGRD